VDWLAAYLSALPLLFALHYALVKARNEHLKKSVALLNREIKKLRKEGVRCAEAERKAVELALIGTRPPLKAALLSTIAPPYFSYVMCGDLRKISEAEAEAYAALFRALRRAGREAPPPEEALKLAVPERPRRAYLALTALTAGAFLLYWWAALIKDLISHSKAHAELAGRRGPTDLTARPKLATSSPSEGKSRSF